MNRRLFLKSLAGAVGAAVVGKGVVDIIARSGPETALQASMLKGEIGRYYNVRFITTPIGELNPRIFADYGKEPSYGEWWAFDQPGQTYYYMGRASEDLDWAKLPVARRV